MVLLGSRRGPWAGATERKDRWDREGALGLLGSRRGPCGRTSYSCHHYTAHGRTPTTMSQRTDVGSTLFLSSGPVNVDAFCLVNSAKYSRQFFGRDKGGPVVGHHTLVATTPRMEGHRQRCHREHTLDRHCFLSRGPVHADAFCLAEPNVGLVVFHKRCMAKWVFSKNV